MPKRTTAEAVRTICSLPSNLNLNGFIETAAIMVDLVEQEGEKDECRLELIERWLTAHMATLTVEPTITEKQIDVTKTKYNVPPSGTSLRDTPYGLQALALDRTYSLEDQYGTKVSSLWAGDVEDHDHYG